MGSNQIDKQWKHDESFHPSALSIEQTLNESLRNWTGRGGRCWRRFIAFFTSSSGLCTSKTYQRHRPARLAHLEPRGLGCTHLSLPSLYTI